MAQFDFFATWEDDWILLERLLQTGTRLIPDGWYETPAVDIYDALDASLKERVQQRRRVFLLREGDPVYTHTGLIQQSRGSMRGFYRVHANELGDVLELTLPACYAEAGRTALGSGSLFHPSEYLNHESGEWGSPSSLKEFSREVRGVLRSYLVRADIRSSKVWIGPDAKMLLDRGDAEVVARGI